MHVSVRSAFVLISVAVASIAVSVRLALSQEGPCRQDLAIVWGALSIPPCQCFSETYFEARDKFRSIANQVGAQLHSLTIVDDYTTDIAIFTGNQPGLVVHTSGVHGIEGYAGSAIQLAWLLTNAGSSPNDRPTIILVHAVNPYGMANYRRFNENNVDLNRNALLPEEWVTVLKRDPNLAGYEDFSAAFNLKSLPSHGSILPMMIYHILRYGRRALKTAMVTGQYHNAQGIFYGGRSLQPSLSKLYGFIEAWLKENPVVSDGNVTWIDVHTGLGPSGQDTILPNVAAYIGSFSEVFNASLIPGINEEGDDVIQGYESATGMSNNYFIHLFEKSAWFLTQEFGTKSIPIMGQSLILENLYYHHLPQYTERGKEILRSAFYVRTPEWRRAILIKGLLILSQAIGRSSN